MDLYKAVCEDQKLKCELVEVAWDGIIPALQEKKIDVIWSSMSITDERKQVIDFTDMYYDFVEHPDRRQVGRRAAGSRPSRTA